MLLVCKNPFGNFVPWKEVEVPDGAVFDTAYFELAEEPAQPEQELDAEEGK